MYVCHTRALLFPEERLAAQPLQLLLGYVQRTGHHGVQSLNVHSHSHPLHTATEAQLATLSGWPQSYSQSPFYEVNIITSP